jgi:Glycosyl hydrolases family 2, TIM barrel domain/Ca-dependent carbohydrate-binding module xylan-binding/Glycosyl hydrolases family 2, sugar binding domain/Glycosyl hydrolases family 2
MMYLRPQSRGRVWAVILGVFTTIGFISQAQATRTELDLDGAWQYQNVSQLTYPPTNSWQTTTVPGFLSGWQYQHAWFRTTFTVPSNLAGTQLKLKFGGVKYNAQVWLNGTFLGSYLNGYEPFEFDVSAAAHVGQTNELIVGVTDWTATFSQPVDFSNLPAGEDARNFVTNDIIAPIGGRYELYGIWQPVKMVSVPAVSIADAFILPSVRSNQLTVRLTIRNDSAAQQTVNIANSVLDGGVTTLSLPPQQITVQAGVSTQLDISAPWGSPHLWSPPDPHLYFLQTSLSSGAGQDQMQTRFGFREFWIQGGRFYLNGTPINLLDTATWPTTDLQDTNQIRQVLEEVKAGNNVGIRFHTQPWDEAWYNIADEIGLLVVEECAVWCDPAAYQLSNPTFWTNYSQHVTAAVKRDRNHPSIILWSLENEILHCGGQKLFSGTEADLAALGAMVKNLDPTRPITYEADLDPNGQADVLGLHYPHEFPDYHVWPNAAYWMNQPIARDWMPGGQWIWDRLKPLYIGEFLWIPGTSAGDFTILFGDDAYTDPAHYRNLSKGLTWQMQIQAYRAYGVNGISPWTEFEDPSVVWGVFDLHPESNYLYQVQKAAYEPNGVFVDQYNTRFFTGQTVQRSLHIYNDTLATNNFVFLWKGGSSAWQSLGFSLPPAGQWQGIVSFQAPATNGPFPLQFELDNATGLAYTNTIFYSAVSPTTLTLSASTKLGLYDPAGSTAALLGRFGLSFVTVTNLYTAPYDQFNLLVIGQNALTAGSVPEVGSGTLAGKWQNFTAQGGWVLVLEQTNYPAWMPGGLQVQSYDASFAFPNPNHPVTADLTADDLRWWADDNRVVAEALNTPSGGNFRVLASIGSTGGLGYAAAVELPMGSGGVLCSQWPLTTRFDTEPLAGVLLQRLLNYCGSSAGHLVLHPVALLTETNSPAAAKLAQLGLQAENYFGHLTNCDPAVYPLLIVAGGNATWQEASAQLSTLTNYVARGGKLVLHRPSDAFLDAAGQVLFPELDYSPSSLGLVLRHDSTYAAAHIANDDLYWVSQPGNWNQNELLSANIASRYYRNKFNLTTYSTIQVESMPIHTSGGASSGGWLLWANGYVAQNINVTQAGTYLFNILASGTPALGGWPQMSLKMDGVTQDSVTVPTNQLAYYTLSADLTPGTHQLAVSFDNDAYAPPEDRNLFLDQILWGRDADNDPSTLLTHPGAVAQDRRGNGLVVLDEIEWDTETQNATKAGRYISKLLTDLGAVFQQSPGVAIAAVTMTNINVSAYSTSGGIAHLNSNGRIETTINFTTAGNYTFTLVAGGNAAAGVMPQIGVTVDGSVRTNFFLTTTNLTTYTITLFLTAGMHAIGLAFLNDYYAPPEDRNAFFSQVTITPLPAFQIIDLNTDATEPSVTLRWETTPNTGYEVQFNPRLQPTNWQSLTTVTSSASITSWKDDGTLSGTPPLTPAAPQRFYRIHRTGP